jgi:molybdopterin converting factor small subunit
VTAALRWLTARYPASTGTSSRTAAPSGRTSTSYVNQDEVRDLPAGFDTPLGATDVIVILPSIAGG